MKMNLEDLKDAAYDTSITAQVKAKLLADDKVSGIDIHVTTNDRVVTLTGEVDNKGLSFYTEDLVKDIDGVLGVVNHLTYNNDIIL